MLDNIRSLFTLLTTRKSISVVWSIGFLLIFAGFLVDQIAGGALGIDFSNPDMISPGDWMIIVGVCGFWLLVVVLTLIKPKSSVSNARLAAPRFPSFLEWALDRLSNYRSLNWAYFVAVALWFLGSVYYGSGFNLPAVLAAVVAVSLHSWSVYSNYDSDN